MNIFRFTNASAVAKRIWLGVVVTLLGLPAWGANAPQPAQGDLFRVTRGGRSALVAVFEVTPKARLIVRLSEGRSAGEAPALFLPEEGAQPVEVNCVLARHGGKRSYSISSCSGADELAGFSARIEPEVPQLDLNAALDPSLTGINSGAEEKSVEGDNCRAYCHYQWQWGISACWLFNPTPGCYDQANLYFIACSAACPL
ncbi:MAG TPA: hypothetical protein VMW27_27995 [Thermoanaerobaculia bacterium]|nr:hypothetical protein [Thermoanaerobaculia bacterium]